MGLKIENRKIGTLREVLQEDAPDMGAKDIKGEEKIQVTTNLTYPNENNVGSIDTGSAYVASTMRVDQESYADWTEEEIDNLDPFKEICVEKWLTEKVIFRKSSMQQK